MHESFLSVEYERDVAVIVLDDQQRSVNTLSTPMMTAIEETLGSLFTDDAVRAIAIVSAKPSGFIAGADIRELSDLSGPRDAEAMSRHGHDMIRRVRRQSKPIVAALHGSTLGGGLELALACTYRIASEDARMGLPEVKLGLLPGGGGTQLLPRLVGLQESLAMMLTGKNVYARKARRIGLVDATVHEPGLRAAAVSAAHQLAHGGLERSDPGPAFPLSLAEKSSVGRRFIYRKAEQRVKSQTRGNYPAPLHIIEAVRTGMENGMDAGFDAEARLFGELVFSKVSRELIFLFFAQQDATRNPWPDLKETGADRIGVLGGGLMGGGIAALSARSGISVRIKDIDLDRAATARSVARDYANGLTSKRAISAFERDRLIERVRPVATYADLAGVELVIEAVPESLELKQDVLRETESVLDKGSVFASNTSSIPITRIAEASSRPERVIGMHYFSPVPQVPLLEIIRTPANSDATIARAFDVGLRQGKTVIVVNDGPGFYTTRILAIYMNEALLLLEEGASIRSVDRAMRDFGFPMGPFALFDLVGIDVAEKIADVLDPFFSTRGHTSSNLARRLSSAGIKGQKTSLGFYRYEDSPGSTPKRKGVNENIYAHAGGSERQEFDIDEIQSRLALIMVNEAIRCLEDGILDRPQDGDVGAVFGLGFPPHLGGPFRYSDSIGVKRLIHRLTDLEARHGLRFDPASILIQMATSGKRFYD